MVAGVDGFSMQFVMYFLGCNVVGLYHDSQIKEHGITDETCSPYLGRGRDSGEVCRGTTL